MLLSVILLTFFSFGRGTKLLHPLPVPGSPPPEGMSDFFI